MYMQLPQLPGHWIRLRASRLPAVLSLVMGAGLLIAGTPSHMPIARKQIPQAQVAMAALSVGPVALAAVSAGLEPASRAESAVFYSPALGRVMPYLIYLPPGNDAQTGTRYPVLYLLHGLGGSYTEWYGYGAFDRADQLIRSGDIPPMIIVLPEGERGYWVDHPDGGPQWGTYVARDLVSEIDGTYPTVADGTHRAIGGMSMGGYGALQLAMIDPGEFGVVGANAPTLHSYDDAPDYRGDPAYFYAHDPPTLIATDPKDAQALSVDLEVGEDDVWLPVVAAFHEELADLGVQHTWSIYPGGHTSESWQARIDDDLRFYGTAFLNREDDLHATAP
jgi:enterochelin esterase-like enzyme